MEEVLPAALEQPCLATIPGPSCLFTALASMWTSLTSVLVLSLSVAAAAPIVDVRNGTYAGVYSEQYNQDFFLGIPFAQPPVGDLRFRNPQSLNTTWTGTRLADAYSPLCVGYGVCSANSPAWAIGEKSDQAQNPLKLTSLIVRSLTKYLTMCPKTVSP
jgi:hypothetical protein